MLTILNASVAYIVSRDSPWAVSVGEIRRKIDIGRSVMSMEIDYYSDNEKARAVVQPEAYKGEATLCVGHLIFAGLRCRRNNSVPSRGVGFLRN